MAKNSMVVMRYSLLERVAHLIHLVSLFVLLITGFKIYMGWDFMTYHNARMVHMIAADFFLIANWAIIPYNALMAECPECPVGAVRIRSLLLHRLSHVLHRYMFGSTDLRRLKRIMLNYLGKGKYPAFTVYNVESGVYVNKTHPVTRIMLPVEFVAVLLAATTGIVLFEPFWGLPGLPICQWFLSVAEVVAPSLDMNAMAFLRTLHLLVAYWFVVELMIHVGILEFDPKVWKYYKARFLTGREDLSDGNYVEVVGNDELQD